GVLLTTPTPVAGPTITAGIGPDLAVDESFIPAGGTGPAGSTPDAVPTQGHSLDTEAFAASFTVNAPAGVQSITYALTINNATTNLIDSTSDTVVTLHQNGATEVD